MIGLLQRVRCARVEVNDKVISAINSGLLVLVGFEKNDTSRHCSRMLQRIINYRVFADPGGKMNLSLVDTGGELLLVPQFTLAADTKSGNRPGFSSAAPPDSSKDLFEELLRLASASEIRTASGEFAAHMQVSLTNDGPVTFWLQV